MLVFQDSAVKAAAEVKGVFFFFCCCCLLLIGWQQQDGTAAPGREKFGERDLQENSLFIQVGEKEKQCMLGREKTGATNDETNRKVFVS